MRPNIGSSIVLGVLALSVGGAACTYDFDRFAKGGNPGGSPAAATGGENGLGGAENPGGTGGELPTGGVGGQAGVGGAGGAGTGGSIATDGASDAPVEASTDYCLDLGGTVYAGHCYKVNATAQTIDVALTSCQLLPGFHLIAITSADEATNVTSLVSASAKDYWIGLRESRSTYSQKNEANLFWVDGEPYNPQTSYRNWDKNEPSFVGDCVLMHATGKWAMANCDTTSLAFICEHD